MQNESRGQFVVLGYIADPYARATTRLAVVLRERGHGVPDCLKLYFTEELNFVRDADRKYLGELFASWVGAPPKEIEGLISEIQGLSSYVVSAENFGEFVREEVEELLRRELGNRWRSDFDSDPKGPVDRVRERPPT